MAGRFPRLAPIEKWQQQMRVIYIAGTSHSGSTLLSLMLNANSEIMSVGEIQNLNRQLKIKPGQKSYPRCSCGASSLWQCNFWRAVDDYVRRKSGKSLLDLDMLDYSNAKDRSGPIKFCLRLSQAYPARISSSILQSIHGEWPLSCAFQT